MITLPTQRPNDRTRPIRRWKALPWVLEVFGRAGARVFGAVGGGVGGAEGRGVGAREGVGVGAAVGTGVQIASTVAPSTAE